MISGHLGHLLETLKNARARSSELSFAKASVFGDGAAAPGEAPLGILAHPCESIIINICSALTLLNYFAHVWSTYPR